MTTLLTISSAMFTLANFFIIFIPIAFAIFLIGAIQQRRKEKLEEETAHTDYKNY